MASSRVMDPALRMLKLLSLLQTHRSWSSEHLSDKLSVSPRTLRRDIDRLREFGYRISAERGVDGGYQLDKGSELPPLVLDDQEAVAMVMGLRANTAGAVAGIEDASIRALAKVEQVLPDRLRDQVSAIQGYTATAQTMWTTPNVAVDTLMDLTRCCRDWGRVTFTYESHNTEATDRRVEPHHLVSVGRRWYLLAFDNNRNDWRTFRIDRITNLECLDSKFAAREIPGGDAVEYVKRVLEGAWQGKPVAIVFEGNVEEVKRAWPARDMDYEVVDTQHTRLRTTSDTMHWMATTAALTGLAFVVEEPVELRDACIGLALRLHAAAKT